MTPDVHRLDESGLVGQATINIILNSSYVVAYVYVAYTYLFFIRRKEIACLDESYRLRIDHNLSTLHFISLLR